ncbi:hypothetical protein CEXT_712821 [Caerostris extrusa]|uniref:Uncharacterized protein n=1 Tax=Caerostris extrusa TaxID=172846 RepID=A0AAV4RMW3_CAEEX|nr:hypothetical protein CEXT_712821 [Caerostris extrusa]
MTAEDVPASAAERLKGLLSFIMARWDVLPSSFPDVNYNVPDDFSLYEADEKQFISQMLSAPNRRDHQRMRDVRKDLPFTSLPAIVHRRQSLSASVIRILGGQRRRRREEPG